MKITEAVILWNNDEGCAVVPQNQDQRHFVKSWGACNAEVHEMNPEQRKSMVFIYAVHLILRDNVPRENVLAEFLKLEEFREGLDPLWLRDLLQGGK